MKLIIMGAPGAGKGTISRELVKKYKIPQISTGDLLREAIKRQNKYGIEAEKYIQHGQLVPDEIVLSLLKDRIMHHDCHDGFILDGFPRTLSQTEALEKDHITIAKVINLEVPDSAIIARITGRRICKKCGEIYHTKFIPPKKPGICNKCQTELFHREDDQEATVKERLKVYYKKTAPLVKFYKKKKILVGVNADRPTKQTLVEINKILKDIK